MLGALEVKIITRLAAERRGEWKLIHTAVMGCLLAHRNRRNGNCWPRRKDIAEYCNVCERTVDRAIARLTEWGAIERMQPKAASSQTFRPAQYIFLFALPQPVENSCGSEDKTCENQQEPCDKNGGSRATKTGGAVRHLDVARNKERRERSKGKDLKRGPSRGFAQSDFDERDLRKMAEAWKLLRERDSQGRARGSDMTPREMFETVCALAGVTIERGLEVEALQKRWPDKVPEWLREKA